MFEPAKISTWQHEAKYPFQDQTRSIAADGLTADQLRLLIEICTMHTYHRGHIPDCLYFGNFARVHFNDNLGQVLTAFHAWGITDTEIIDFCTLTKVGMASRVTVERTHDPADDPWLKTLGNQTLHAKSHVLWMGASSTGWFNVLVGRSQHQFAQAMAK